MRDWSRHRTAAAAVVGGVVVVSAAAQQFAEGRVRVAVALVWAAVPVAVRRGVFRFTDDARLYRQLYPIAAANSGIALWSLPGGTPIYFGICGSLVGLGLGTLLAGIKSNWKGISDPKALDPDDIDEVFEDA